MMTEILIVENRKQGMWTLELRDDIPSTLRHGRDDEPEDIMNVPMGVLCLDADRNATSRCLDKVGTEPMLGHPSQVSFI